MRKSFVLIAAVLVVLACTLAAQEPVKAVGRWNVSIETENGTFTETLTLEQNGNALKGTMASERGESQVEGTLEGQKITFNVIFETPDGEKRTIPHTGTVSGDTMKGTLEFGENTVEWSAKRAQA